MSKWETIGMSDEWYTPSFVFETMQCRFDLDVAASFNGEEAFVPADRFIHEGSLTMRWNGFIWMNPPFGGRNGIIPWLIKFCEHANGIALTPDRTSAFWWQDMACKCDAVLFVHKKIKFVRPDGSIGKNPSTGTTLFAIGDRACSALKNAEKNGLGKYFEQL